MYNFSYNDDVWCVRTGGWGKRTYKKQTFLKSSLQKSSAFEFLNLTLHAREARGTAKPHWFSLVGGKENQSENDLVPVLVSIYNSARTYFSNNPA